MLVESELLADVLHWQGLKKSQVRTEELQGWLWKEFFSVSTRALQVSGLGGLHALPGCGKMSGCQTLVQAGDCISRKHLGHGKSFPHAGDRHKACYQLGAGCPRPPRVSS